MTTKGILIAAFQLLLVTLLRAQIVPLPADNAVALGAMNLQTAVVSAGQTVKYVDVVVDSSTNGGDLIEVIAGDDPAGTLATVPSLVLPNGVEVTSATAASLGLTFSTYSFNIGSYADFPSLESDTGTHTVIQLPQGAPSGVYRVKIDGTALTSDVAVKVVYYSSSAVKMGAATDSPFYRFGDSTLIAGILFDGSSPISGATVTASVATSTPVLGSIGAFQLVSQSPSSDSATQFTYRAQFAHAGSAQNVVIAVPSSSDDNTVIIDSPLVFGSVPANGTVTSTNTFIVEIANTSSFDPAVISWELSSPNAPVSVSLSDAGDPGSGAYSGSFTASAVGDYTAFITASGTSASGTPFARSAITTFRVSSPQARLNNFSDSSTQDTTGAIGQVTLSYAIDVQTAGTYQLSLVW